MSLARNLQDTPRTHSPQSWGLKEQGVSSQHAGPSHWPPARCHGDIPPPLGAHLHRLLPACPAREALRAPGLTLQSCVLPHRTPAPTTFSCLHTCKGLRAKFLHICSLTGPCVGLTCLTNTCLLNPVFLLTVSVSLIPRFQNTFLAQVYVSVCKSLPTSTSNLNLLLCSSKVYINPFRSLSSSKSES